MRALRRSTAPVPVKQSLNIAKSPFYLVEVRGFVASKWRLRRSGKRSHSVGYESGAAFSKAFKQVVGVTRELNTKAT
jgi:hypothetical protein